MRWIFLHSIERLEPGVCIEGKYTWPGELELFRDHFPEWPVVPGVLVMESLAQLAGKAIGYTLFLNRGDWPFPILSMMRKVKFRSFIKPDTEVTLKAEFISLRNESANMKVSAWVDGQRRATAEQVFVFNAVPLDDPEKRERLRMVEGGELARLWPEFDIKAWGGQTSEP